MQHGVRVYFRTSTLRHNRRFGWESANFCSQLRGRQPAPSRPANEAILFRAKTKCEAREIVRDSFYSEQGRNATFMEEMDRSEGALFDWLVRAWASRNKVSFVCAISVGCGSGRCVFEGDTRTTTILELL